ncbi:MAG: hypothetical protein ACI8QC_002816 [Planctomycetota bacterium]|jgi:hypothetical protein
MTQVLGAGLSALQQELKLKSDGSQIERVEARKDGSLLFTVELAERMRWFRFHAEGLEELRPHKDRRLPLALANAEAIRNGSMEVLAWRPGRRIALLEHGDSPRVLKGYRKGRAEEAARRYRHAAAAMPAQAPFVIPHLQSWDAEQDALCLTWVDGQPLPISSPQAKTFRKVGQLLRQLQDGSSTEHMQPHDALAELQLLEDLALRVERLTPLPSGWREQLARLSEKRDWVLGRVLRTTHRDLHDGQLLRTGERLVLLDLDLLCAGDPALDVANLTAQLQLRALQGLREATQISVEACSRALLEGIGRASEPGFRNALRFYQASTFLRLALVYSVRPRWTAVCPELTTLATQCVEDIDD